LKIGEFAELNSVTTKMLRHYDEISLLKPSCTDEATGYRSAKAGRESVEDTAKAIIQGMAQYDFGSLGCGKQMGCYIGGLAGLNKDVTSVRSMIEQSIESINEAREKGKNSVVIHSLARKAV